MESLAEKASRFFDNHYSCAEAVVLAGQEFLGSRYRLPSSAASVLGGGIAGKGMTCGALTGALLLVGLAHGRRCPQEEDQHQRALEMACSILERFKKEHGTWTCEGLTGYDLNNPSDREMFGSDPRRRERCRSYVETAGRLLEEVLANQ